MNTITLNLTKLDQNVTFDSSLFLAHKQSYWAQSSRLTIMVFSFWGFCCCTASQEGTEQA